MITEVLMERPLFSGMVRQSNQSSFLCLTDLLLVGNKWRAENGLPMFNYNSWYSSPSTKEFLAQIEKELGIKVINSKKGRKGERWAHPFVFIDLALAISPSFKIEVYKWLYDELLKHRNNSGDSYRKMAGALYDNATNKGIFSRSMAKTAIIIQGACGVTDWQKATEKQLKLRDKIHDNIALLATILRKNNDAIRLGIEQALLDYKKL